LQEGSSKKKVLPGEKKRGTIKIKDTLSPTLAREVQEEGWPSKWRGKKNLRRSQTKSTSDREQKHEGKSGNADPKGELQWLLATEVCPVESKEKRLKKQKT